MTTLEGKACLEVIKGELLRAGQGQFCPPPLPAPLTGAVSSIGPGLGRMPPLRARRCLCGRLLLALTLSLLPASGLALLEFLTYPAYPVLDALVDLGICLLAPLGYLLTRLTKGHLEFLALLGDLLASLTEYLLVLICPRCLDIPRTRCPALKFLGLPANGPGRTRGGRNPSAISYGESRGLLLLGRAHPHHPGVPVPSTNSLERPLRILSRRKEPQAEPVPENAVLGMVLCRIERMALEDTEVRNLRGLDGLGVGKEAHGIAAALGGICGGEAPAPCGPCHCRKAEQ